MATVSLVQMSDNITTVRCYRTKNQTKVMLKCVKCKSLDGHNTNHNDISLVLKSMMFKSPV